MDDRYWPSHSMAAPFVTFFVAVLVLRSIIRKERTLKRSHGGPEVGKNPNRKIVGSEASERLAKAFGFDTSTLDPVNNKL